MFRQLTYLVATLCVAGLIAVEAQPSPPLTPEILSKLTEIEQSLTAEEKGDLEFLIRYSLVHHPDTSDFLHFCSEAGRHLGIDSGIVDIEKGIDQRIVKACSKVTKALKPSLGAFYVVAFNPRDYYRNPGLTLFNSLITYDVCSTTFENPNKTNW